MLRKLVSPLVVKADGLAAGKGVLVCQELSEAKEAVDLVMTERAFGDAGNEVIIEEFYLEKKPPLSPLPMERPFSLCQHPRIIRPFMKGTPVPIPAAWVRTPRHRLSRLSCMTR